MIRRPVLVILVPVLLFMTFKSTRLSFLVFVNLPSALTGGVSMLLITHTYLSVPASAGFIILLVLPALYAWFDRD